MREVTIDNGQTCWVFGFTHYVRAAVNNVEKYLAKKGTKLVDQAATALTSEYRPDIDIIDELGEEQASYHYSPIGVLCWIMELGQADIYVEVSMMSSHLALTCIDHMGQVLHVFMYLKECSNSKMVFDPSRVDFDMSPFAK